MPLSDQIIAAESGGDPNARNPNSSAGGSGQFIDNTWLAMLSQHRPDLVQGKSPSELLALKSDPTLSRQMVEAYAGDNAKTLQSAGLSVTPGSLYLAHFAGPQGAVNILKASPDSPAADVLGPGATKANPFLARMTVADLQRWAAGKVGASSDAPASNASPAASQGQPVGMLDVGGLDAGRLGGGEAQPQALAPEQAPAPAAAAQEAPQPPTVAPPQFRHLPLTDAVRMRLLANLIPQNQGQRS